MSSGSSFFGRFAFGPSPFGRFRAFDAWAFLFSCAILLLLLYLQPHCCQLGQRQALTCEWSLSGLDVSNSHSACGKNSWGERNLLPPMLVDPCKSACNLCIATHKHVSVLSHNAVLLLWLLVDEDAVSLGHVDPVVCRQPSSTIAISLFPGIPRCSARCCPTLFW